MKKIVAEFYSKSSLDKKGFLIVRLRVSTLLQEAIVFQIVTVVGAIISLQRKRLISLSERTGSKHCASTVQENLLCAHS